MHKIPLFPILFFLAGFIPFVLFLWMIPSVLGKHFKTVVSNDPQNSLSQSLAALSNTQGSFQKDLYLKALRIAALGDLQKAIGKPTPQPKEIQSALANALEPSSGIQMALLDSNGNALFNNMGLAAPAPSPAPIINNKKKNKSHSLKPLPILYPSLKDWPGLSPTLTGGLQQGAFVRAGQAYWGCDLPVSFPKQKTGALVLAVPLDAAWLKRLSKEAFNDLIFYSQGQTLLTCPSSVPVLQPSQIIAPENHPEKRAQIDWDGLTFLVDGIGIPGMDGKILGRVALFQPVRKTVALMGDPTGDLLRFGILCLAAMTAFLLALGWGYAQSFKQALVSIAGIKYGSPSMNLPVQRGDEWGRLARSLKEMWERFKEKERVSLILGKYMAPDVAKKILVEKNFFALEGETRECALMVVELRGTEALESTSTPQMGVQTLNQYFTLIQDSVARQGGLVDYFLSHQAHAAWGVPFPTENPAAKAAQSALEIMENLITLNTEKISKNEPTLDFSIGLHYGPVTAGNIGSDRLYGYSVTGRRVETTKALALYADPRQILATSEFIRQGGDALSATLLPSRSLEKLGETALYEISAKP